MQLTNAILALSAAAAVSAHPSMHGHGHHQHARRAPDFMKAGRPITSIPPVAGNVKAESSATSTSSPAATSESSSSTSSAAASSSSASSSDSGTGQTKSWPCSGSSKRATTYDIFSVGNVGTPWGCNWMEIENGDTDLYDYTMTFESPDYDMTCQCWNKIGPDGGVNGHWEDMLKLSLPKGSKKSLALQADTQGACGCSTGSSVEKCPNAGYYAGTWVEVDMGSEKNKLNGVPQSGADVSALTVMDCALQDGGETFDFPGMKISANGDFCSGMTANNGASYYAYVVGTDQDGVKIHDADGVGCKGYGTNNLNVLLGDVTWDNMGRD
ncbi:hypothetical protein MKZ38_010484 [Zalerion maritima]|uniref:Allergen Asp f 4 n=1 Tax=Zalerion maritima TaxID=339359 RepID=A0AAD5RTX2_9PEZI|nr:hypothetical protein MKZ38_010484 [Zalerion maritima]